MTWFDDGSRIRVYVSTDGDYMSIGDRYEYPFTAGSGGVPAGWAFWAEVGSSSDVYMGVLNGRWWCQNVSTTNANNGGKYNIWRDFFVDANVFNYTFLVQAQIMPNRSMAYRGATYAPNNTSGPYGTIMAAQTNWEQVNLPAWSLSPTTNFVRIYLQANPYWANAADARPDWGVQFQSFTMMTTPKDPSTILWEEVTCDVQRCQSRYGRAKFTSRYDVASSTLIVRNDDGQFSYNPYPETGGFRPGRFIRVTGTPPGSSTEYPIYHGMIDSVADDYGLDGRAVINMQCVDTSSLLSNTNVPTITAANQQINSGTRIWYLAAANGWDLGKTLIDNGVFTQQGIVANGRSIRDEMGLSADSEGGYLYMDRVGNLVYRNRDAPTTESRWNTVQAELLAECNDDGLPPVDNIPTVTNPSVVMLNELRTDWSRDRIINDLMVGNQGGTAMSFTNKDSMKRYGPRTYQRLDFVNWNATASYLTTRAADLMNGFSDAILRVNSVRFRPTVDNYQWALTVFLNDLVRVRYTNRLNGWGFSVVSHVQQVLHSITTQGWEVELLLDQPVAFNSWNEAETGTGWDESRWDDGKWDGVLQAFWSRDSTTWSDGISTWG